MQAIPHARVLSVSVYPNVINSRRATTVFLKTHHVPSTSSLLSTKVELFLPNTEKQKKKKELTLEKNQ